MVTFPCRDVTRALAYSATAVATEMLVTALQVNVATDKPSYAKNAWVVITALVTGEDRVSGMKVPMRGASVTFTSGTRCPTTAPPR